ncbi:MAG: MgtC/SapB family protein [Nanoarchaeota archaeon]
MEWYTIIGRFILIFLLAFFFGIQRQRAHKPIGFGTFIFVSCGAAALAIVAMTHSATNPLPLLSAIVTGIGFLGAGALIKTTDKIFGFTTAAGIWAFAVLGLTIGVGDYLVASILYAIMWSVVLIDMYLERNGIGSYQRKLVVTTTIVPEQAIETEFGKARHKLIAVEVSKKNHTQTVTYLVEGSKGAINKIPKRLYAKDWFEHLKVE